MLSLMQRKKYFLEIWFLAHKKYSVNNKRLAAEGWSCDWQLLVATMMSAQSRDEITIPVAESLFEKYGSLKKLAGVSIIELKEDIWKINYNSTKAKHISETANILLKNFGGKVPSSSEELIKLPGVGVKTANLVASELFGEDAICVDTHVHRISNVFGFVKTKTPEQTERELKLVVPKNLWGEVNRIFVLWGQDVKGYDRQKFLDKLKD